MQTDFSQVYYTLLNFSDSEPQDLMIENDRLRLKITDLEREVEEVRKVVISRMSERQ